MASCQIAQEQQPWLLENGNPKVLTKESRHGRSRNAHNLSTSSLRKKSEYTLLSKVQRASFQNVLLNIQEVILGTKLSILFLAIPAAILAHYFGLGRVSSS
jgi:Ca2+:H+ antiporter